MIGIVDYGVGNIFSLKRSLDYIGVNSLLSSDNKELSCADKIILPGVGAFGDAMDKLRESRLADLIKDEAKEGKYILGICLGMQLLFDKSVEYGEHEGLGMIPGYVEDMKKLITDPELDIPEMGWNKLSFPRGEKHPLFKYTEDKSYVYFVHGFAATDCKPNIIATTDYSCEITAAVAKGNVMGVQFHPEKSGEVGLGILRGFAEL